MIGRNEGKVALVTGSAQGIGAGITEVLLREGATVIGIDRDPAKGPFRGSSYHHELIDVTDYPKLESFLQAVETRFGHLDILVNNAGTSPPHGPVDEVSVEDFERLIRINLTSVFVACKAALPSLRKSRGCIVNISSLVALQGQDGAAAYCATKGGISSMSKSIAIDEGRNGVRVNCIVPGQILTPLWGSPSAEAIDLAASTSWLNRVGHPAEVGELASFLASEMAGFITGLDVPISGGAELGYGLKAQTYVDAIAAAL